MLLVADKFIDREFSCAPPNHLYYFNMAAYLDCYRAMLAVGTGREITVLRRARNNA